MKCPHCDVKVGLFSKELNAIGETKVCGSCGKPVKLGIRRARFAIAFIAVAVASIFLGLSGPIAAGVAGGIGAAFGLGLQNAA
jgi:hypothetical protein